MSARGLAALALSMSVLVSAPLRAQDAPEGTTVEARQQYNQGTQAYKEKKFVEAALHFEAAAAQRPHAVTLYTAALAWEQANKPERAADDFVRALEVPGLSAQQATNELGLEIDRPLLLFEAAFHELADDRVILDDEYPHQRVPPGDEKWAIRERWGSG